MQDTCQIGVYSATQDASGEETATYTYGSDVVCGFSYTVSGEQWSALLTYSRIDAVLRLPLGTVVAVRDRVHITKRWGTALATALTFGIAGHPLDGPSGIVVPLVDTDL